MEVKKTILITGCRRGIGRDSAIKLASLGHNVIATVHRQKSVEDLKLYAKEKGVELNVFKLDILDANDQQKILNFDIDVLINNAAIGESGSLLEIPIALIEKNFQTNLFATLQLTQLALKKMMKKDSGRIIIISSIAGRFPMSFWGSYSMTKFSLSTAADIMRQEIKQITKNVNICVVEPGAYHTGFNQDIQDTKYVWMNESSYFYKMMDTLKKQEKNLKLLERKNTNSIVKQIVKAVEAQNPRLRYTAPWWQAAAIQLARIYGK